MVYVERNPVEAGLVTRAEEGRWSSARAHLSGVDEGLLDMVEFRERYTGERWKSRLELGLRDAALVERLREGTVPVCAQSGNLGRGESVFQSSRFATARNGFSGEGFPAMAVTSSKERGGGADAVSGDEAGPEERLHDQRRDSGLE
jgi:hypothetical protein